MSADRAAVVADSAGSAATELASLATAPEPEVAADPEARNRNLAGPLAPGQRLDERVRLGADGSVTITTGKVELGQGIHDALRLIVAEELDVPVARIRVAPVDTQTSPDEGRTAASRSVEQSGGVLRLAAAELRRALRTAAAQRLGVPPDELTPVAEGLADRGGRSVTFAELATLVADAVAIGDPELKLPEERTVLGSSVRRDDLERKLTGAPAYVQDLELPGMLHGRIVRPPGPGARLERLHEEALASMPGVVAVIRIGSFLGVLAEREEQAIAARARAGKLATWTPVRTGPAVSNQRYLLAGPSEETVIHAESRPSPAALATLDAEYSRGHLAHAAVAPSCAVARCDGDGSYEVWATTQDVFALRWDLANVLGTPPDDVRVIHMEGAGCYGHNGADDVALDAALLARAMPGRPVRVQWMRDDEFRWEPFGPGALVRLHGGLDASGAVVDWVHEVWSHSHGGRPSPHHEADESALLAAGHLERPFHVPRRMRPSLPWDDGRRNAVPLYTFARQRIVDHYVPDPPLRVSALRSLGAHVNVFAAESFLDELAALGSVDPVELRLRHLNDPRAREVIDRAASLAGWAPGEKAGGDRGRGIAFARYKNKAAYAAVVVEVEVDTEIRVRRAWAAIDAGTVVTRDGLLNQVEGGITQAVSQTLHEEVTTDESGVTSLGWDSYRTLRFPDAPEIQTAVIDRPTEPSLGAGEAMTGPTAAAIGNAVFHALGVRVRDMPLSRQRVIAAMPK